MTDWIKTNDLNNLTFFGQDWGGLIGLRVVANQPDRFLKVAMGNTGLPYNPDVPQDVIDKIKAFRNSDIKLNPISMQREIRKMDGKKISYLCTLLIKSKNKLGLVYKVKSSFLGIFNYTRYRPFTVRFISEFLIFDLIKIMTGRSSLKKVEHLPSIYIYLLEGFEML